MEQFTIAFHPEKRNETRNENRDFELRHAPFLLPFLSLKTRRRQLLAAALVAGLAACGPLTFEDDYPTTSTTADEESGSIFDLFRSNDTNIATAAGADGAPVIVRGGLGVNSLLWQASLDTLSFMPLASADPQGGVIITDWYNDPAASDERVKVNLVISGRELRADALRVNLFRENFVGGKWVGTAASSKAARQLENIILTRARDLSVASRSAR